MKVKILLLALVIMGISACTQRTCPTYAKKDAPKVEKEEQLRI